MAYDFDIGGGEQATLWPFKPNWSNPLVETLEWSTAILQSYNGNEQRIANRQNPRVATDYGFLVHSRAAQRLDNLLWARQNRRLALPLWQYVTSTTAEAAATADIVEFDPAFGPFIDGGWLVLMRSETQFEVCEIATVEVGGATLAAPLAETWPVGTRVYPLHLGFFDGDVALRRETDRAVTGALRFISDPVTADAFIPVAEAGTTYDGYEFLATKPNWNGGINAPQSYPLDRTDFGIGAIAYNRTVNTPTITRDFEWLLKSRSEITAFREFLGRRVGRQKAFYAPTWNLDLELIGNVGSGDTEINVRENLVGELVGLDPSRTHVYIRLKSGTTYLREITDVTPAGEATTLTISTSLGANVAVADVRSIHFVSLWRLASDSVALQWFSPTVAVVDTPLVLVKP